MSPDDRQFVSRAGEKFAAALDTMRIVVAGLVCADLGCNVGGFTDCLLRRGARKVYAVDTGYGELAWTLRKDPRVVVMERTNALHCELSEPVDLATIDTAWTPQERIVPAALRLLAAGGQIVSLLKPHYELAKLAGRKPVAGLSDEQAEEVCRHVCERLSALCEIRAKMPSPLRGKGGNIEYLLLLAPPGGKNPD